MSLATWVRELLEERGGGIPPLALGMAAALPRPIGRFTSVRRGSGSRR
jgi:hypothetical protein